MRHLILVLLLVLPLGALAQTAQEERDRSFLSDTIEDLLSTEGQIVRIDGFRGALSSRATVARLSIADAEGEWLIARDLSLDWTRSALLSRRLDISELAAGSIEILRAPEGDSPPPQPEAVPFALPDLPVSVQIDALSAERIMLGEALIGQEVVLSLEGDAELAQGAGDVTFTARRIDGGEGEITLAGTFSNETRVLALDLAMSEGADGIAATLLGIPGTPPLDLVITGTAPIDDYAADIHLATDGVNRVEGHFATRVREEDGARTFALDLEGNVAPLLAPDYRAFFGDDTALHVLAILQPDGALDLPELDIRAQALRLAGYLRLGPDGWPDAFSLAGDLGLADGAPVRLPAGAELEVGAMTLALDYNATEGEDWRGQFGIDGLQGEGFAVERLTLEGGGRITVSGDTEGDESERVFSLAMTYVAAGIALDDPGLAQAVGETATGRIDMQREGDGVVALREATLTGPGIDAALSGTIGGERLAYDLRLALQAGDLGRFATLVGLDLGGSADLAIRLAGRALNRSLRLTATGGTRDLALGIGAVDPLLAGEGLVSLAATRDEAGLRVERLNARTTALTASGSADLTSAAQSGRFDLRLDNVARLVSGLDGTAVITLDMQRDEAGIAAQAEAAIPGAALEITATQAPEEEDFALRVTGGIPDLAAFADLAGLDLTGRADLALRGRAGTEAVDLALAARIDAPGTGVAALDPLLGDLAVLGARISRGADQVLRLDRLSLGAAQVNAAGTVELAPDGALSLDLAGSARGADAHVAGMFAEGVFTGSADLDLRDLATTSDGAVTGSAQLGLGGQVSGDLTQMDLSLTGVTHDIDTGIEQIAPLTRGPGEISATILRTDGGPFRIEDLRYATPAAQLSGRGETDGAAAQATVSLDLNELRNVMSGASGPVRASADIRRDADGILALDLQADGLGATATLAAEAEGPDPMEGITGRLDVVAANLAPLGRMAGMTLRGAGEAVVAGRVTPADLSADLEIDATLRNLDPGNADLAQVLAGEGRVTARLSHDTEGRMAAENVSLRFPNLTVSGSASGTVENLAARFEARLANVGLLAPDFSGPATASGTATMRAGTWELQAGLTGPGGMRADVSGGISSAGVPDLRASGALPLGLANGFIEPRRLRGEGTFDLRLSGQTGIAGLTGSLRTSGAEAADPEFGLHVTGIGGSAAFASGRAMLDLQGAVDGGGTVAARGSIGLDSALSSDLTVTIRSAVLRDPELYETTASGEIRISGPLAGAARIGGRIDLGQTELRIPSSDIGGLGDLPPVVHVGAPGQVRETLARARVNSNGAGADTGGSGAYTLDVLLSAPARVFIRGRGLDAELGGSLRLGGTTANIIPSGGFSLIRGRLDILQQRFVLSEGVADMQGSFTPWLHLVARTRARTGTDVAITLEGPAGSPQVIFSSQPELPQDEVLAQLLFGRDIASISPLQAVQLAAAVATLAGRGGGGIVDSLRTGLGVDDFDVVTGEDGSAGLRLGRYLGENLYTDVTLGDETQVNINLDLTRDITVTGSVGADGETRLGIHFERDY